MNNDRIREYYPNFQNLANILLIIAGKFDINELRAGINKFFQDIPPGRRPANPGLQRPESAKILFVEELAGPGPEKEFCPLRDKSSGQDRL